MTHFWTDEQIAQVTPGATVCVSGSLNHASGRYRVTGTSEAFVSLETAGGVGFTCPWKHVDPGTLSVRDTRQTSMFD